MNPVVLKLRNPIQATISLVIKRMYNGDIIVYDHPEVNVVFSTKERKMTIMPKSSMSDHVWNVQKRMSDYFVNKGVVQPKSVRGGNVFFTLEAKLFEPGPDQKHIDPLEIFLYTIATFLKSEEPYYQKYNQNYDEEVEHLTSPDDKYATELGKVPHKLDPAFQNAVNLATYNYRVLWEGM